MVFLLNLIIMTRTLRYLTFACQIVLKELLKALGSLYVGHDTTEVVIGDNVVLWISHHVDNLTSEQTTIRPEVKVVPDCTLP